MKNLCQMRSLLRNLSIFLSFSLPGIAGAQESANSAQSAADVPDVHVVAEGDTLWGICDKYFSDPWRWPTVWALNPHITNPHWIYPEDIVRLKRTRPKAPEIMELPALYTVDVESARLASVNEGFIAEKDLETLGKLAAAHNPRQYLAMNDDVYVEFKELDKVKVGDSYSIFNIGNEVTHPDSGDVMGHKILVMGELQVTDIDKKYAKAKITHSRLEIQRGMKVVPLVATETSVSPRENLVEVKGVILEALREGLEMGQYHVVLLDRGSKDGVQIGNRFFVQRRGDEFVDAEDVKDTDLPWERIGEVMVVHLQDHTSTAIVTRSTEELHRGDMIVMQKNY